MFGVSLLASAPDSQTWRWFNDPLTITTATTAAILIHFALSIYFCILCYTHLVLYTYIFYNCCTNTSAVIKLLVLFILLVLFNTNWNSTKIIKWSHCQTTTLIINLVDTDTIIFVSLSWQVEPFLDWIWWLDWMKERNLISVSKIARSSFISEITHLIKSDINTQVQPSFTSKIQISPWYSIEPICSGLYLKNRNCQFLQQTKCFKVLQIPFPV